MCLSVYHRVNAKDINPKYLPLFNPPTFLSSSSIYPPHNSSTPFPWVLLSLSRNQTLLPHPN